MTATTDWLPGSLQPEYVGVYQRDYAYPDAPPREDDGSIVYSYWDGENWYVWANTPTEAREIATRYSGLPPVTPYPNQPWRGCTTKQGPVQYSRAGTSA